MADIRRLARDGGARARAGAFVIEGPTLVGEAVRAGLSIETAIVSASGAASVADLCGELTASGTAVAMVEDHVFESLATTTSPQPVIAVAATPRCPLAVLVEGTGLLFVLDGLSDPGNLGTLLRSAEAAGAAGVVTGAGTVDPFGPKVVRASAGALFHVPVVTGMEAAAALAELRAGGWTIVGTVASGGESHVATDLGGRVAVVLGNEAHGLSPAVAQGIDRWLTVEQVGRSDSLNVAMAGTVIAFEALRQRNQLDHAEPSHQGGRP